MAATARREFAGGVFPVSTSLPALALATAAVAVPVAVAGPTAEGPRTVVRVHVAAPSVSVVAPGTLVTLRADVGAGTGCRVAWDDGTASRGTGAGCLARHRYLSPGVRLLTVRAGNATGQPGRVVLVVADPAATVVAAATVDGVAVAATARVTSYGPVGDLLLRKGNLVVRGVPLVVGTRGRTSSWWGGTAVRGRPGSFRLTLTDGAAADRVSAVVVGPAGRVVLRADGRVADGSVRVGGVQRERRP